MSRDKTGRNDPCPCGSGLKFKRCCLAAAGPTAPAAPYTKEERLAARAALDDFTDREEWEQIAGEAVDEFWGSFADDLVKGKLEEETVEQCENSFISWLWFDYRLPEGRLVVDRFLERSSMLLPGERKYLEQMQHSSHRLYEIEGAVPGVSLTLRDLSGGGSVTVQERLGSRSLRRWDLVAARLALPAGASGKPEIDDLVPLPPYAKDAILAEVKAELSDWTRAHPGADEREFFKSYAPGFHQEWLAAVLNPPIPKVLFGGEEALITRVRFDVLDRAAVVEAFDGARDMIREGGEPGWHWQPPGKKEPPTSVRFEGEALLLEAFTKGAGERAARRVERLLKGKVRKSLTTHEDLSQAMKRSRSEPRPPPPELPEADEMVLEYYERHYRAWLDEPIPALEGATPREAARTQSLDPALVDLLKELERSYGRSLEMGEPGYDPFWMWEELGLSDRPEAPAARKEPPPLGHETMGRLVPGLAEAARVLADRLRRRADFDLETVATEKDLKSDLSVRRFLENYARTAAAGSANLLGTHLAYLTNYELHHRKTFWLEEGLAWMLARTNLDIQADAVRLPFSSFALVFTDRDTLSLAERLLAKEKDCTHRGRILRVVTVYVTAISAEATPGASLVFLFDDLSEDWPYLIQRDLPFEPKAHLDALLESRFPGADPSIRDPVFESPLFKRLLQRALNAILYATSAGITMEPRRASPGIRRELSLRGAQTPFSSEEVFFLPGHIDIRDLRQLQAVERAPGGGRLIHKFLVRGHWRRANPSWKDPRNRWIQPYWKGPQLAAVVERAYRLRAPASVPSGPSAGSN